MAQNANEQINIIFILSVPGPPASSAQCPVLPLPSVLPAVSVAAQHEGETDGERTKREVDK